jgi:uncharacterized repeat protein (TIGR01451 family)
MGRNSITFKLDENANLIWSFHAPLSGTYFSIQNITVNSSGIIMLTGVLGCNMNINGTNYSPLGVSDLIILELSSNGLFIDFHQFECAGNIDVRNLKINNAGEIYIVGSFSNSVNFGPYVLYTVAFSGGFVLKTDALYNPLWAQNISGLDGTNECLAICLSNDDNIFITGGFSYQIDINGITYGSNYAEEIFILKMGPQGNINWFKTFPSTDDSWGSQLKIDYEQNLYLAGGITETMFLDNGETLFSSGSIDPFYMKLDTSGTIIYAKSFGSPSMDILRTSLLDNQGNLYLTGTFYDTLYIDNFILPNANIIQTYLIKINDNGNFESKLITGKLYSENIINCNYDTSEAPIKNSIVKTTPGNYFGMSDSLGNYKLQIPLDTLNINYSIAAVPNNYLAYAAMPICPINNNYNIGTANINDTISGFDFGFNVSPCHHLELQIASNMRRRCFTNLTSINYQNTGLNTANAAQIIVEFPHYVVPISSSIPWIYLNDSTYKFNIGDILPGQSGMITITDSVKCNNVGILGMVQCTKASILPAPDCVPLNYSGAQINLNGYCNDSIVYLDIFNEGTANMIDSVNYYVYYDSILVQQSKVLLNSDDTLHLMANANGHSVHLKVNQVENHPTELFASIDIEACGLSVGQEYTNYINHFPLPQSPQSKTNCLNITGAYDPNDKQVFPIGFTSNHIIQPNTPLTYLIRFQNTGNDTAINILIIDTLSAFLNPESIEIGAVSHACNYSLQTNVNGKTALKFQFNNIMLPDSTTNLLASQGFVQFRINPFDSLALGTQVHNEAAIYFDYNPPIITNQTLSTYDNIIFVDSSLNNTVYEVPLITNISNITASILKIYPNPVLKEDLTITTSSKGLLNIYDIIGNCIYTSWVNEGNHQLPVALNSGIYFASLKTENKTITVKMVVN